MKTIQINAYYFHELSEEVQYKIIENNRETICDYEMQFIHNEMDRTIEKFMYFVSAYVNRCGGLILDDPDDNREILVQESQTLNRLLLYRT